MCGRFVQALDPNLVQTEFNLSSTPNIPDRYNVAPTQFAGVISNDQRDELVLYKWGLIPSWSKDPTIGGRMINARSETLEEKASFKTPLRRKRCIVPVSGFYEWQAREGGKFPIYIYPKAQPIFALAGLWDSWRDPVSGDELRTFTIITTAANGFMRQYHERMPVILRREDYDLWLSPAEKTPDQLRPLLRPFDEDALTAHEVSRAVNTPAVDNPTLIERAG